MRDFAVRGHLCYYVVRQLSTFRSLLSKRLAARISLSLRASIGSTAVRTPECQFFKRLAMDLVGNLAAIVKQVQHTLVKFVICIAAVAFPTHGFQLRLFSKLR